ncbi:MAG TPA: hypothetical protein VFX70_14175 [Mycobacteriales bacterium]|nr:hypothetical protein [Mycobacteriales bacterium]
MRLTHTSALRGFAVFTAGAAMFASAMLAGAGVANASDVTSPAQAAPLAAAAAHPGLNEQNGDHHCWRHHKHGKKSWGDKKNGKDSKDSRNGKDSKSDMSWGDKKNGNDDKSKRDSEHGKWGSEHSDGQDGSMDPRSRQDSGSDCHMPTGSVESGFGGAALSGSQSPATTISLGALSALMLGSGVWSLYRSRRRNRVRPATR